MDNTVTKLENTTAVIRISMLNLVNTFISLPIDHFPFVKSLFRIGFDAIQQFHSTFFQLHLTVPLTIIAAG